MKISVSNNQTSVKIVLKSFRGHVARLSEGVFANLRANTPKHLTVEMLDGFASRGTLSVSIVSNQKIQALNKKWRQKNSATDVLSFSLAVEDEDALQFALMVEDMPLEVGEIIISAPRAKQQAFEYGHSFEREMAFLFVHGLLHVLGFDHMTKKDEKDMFARQNEILDLAGFPRLPG